MTTIQTVARRIRPVLAASLLGAALLAGPALAAEAQDTGAAQSACPMATPAPAAAGAVGFGWG